jgi:hypothetical protein
MRAARELPPFRAHLNPAPPRAGVPAVMNRISPVLVCTAVLLLLPLSSGCRRKQETQPPVATPAVAFNHTKAPLGSPVDVKYRFKVAADAPPFKQDYRVMVHFLDADQELMWTDDHQPPIPTSQWKPGQVIEYSRTVFIPIYPYIGEAQVTMGLYPPSGGTRLPLAGTDVGQRAYKVASLQLLPQTENVFLVYKDGWQSPEVATSNSLVEWQWTKKVATIAFRNPGRDSLFYLQADNPGNTFKEPQTVKVLLNAQPVDQFTIEPKQEILRRVRLPRAQLGSGEMAELRLQVDKTFVPALLPAAGNHDTRELGIRVFHAFVQPL